MLTYIDCPLCLNQNYKPLFANRENVVKCEDCGLVYVNPRPVEAETDEKFHYEPSLQEGFLKGIVADRDEYYQRFKERLKDIERFKKRGRILDIGCSNGFFLDVARRQGWQASGLEISRVFADYARKELGLDIKTRKLEEAGFGDNSFDVVTMWEIIEHLYSPLDTLKHVKRVLKEDGLLSLSVPNMGSLAFSILKEDWSDFSYLGRHFSFFTPRTMRRLLDKAGFKVVKVSTEGIGKQRIIQALTQIKTSNPKRLGDRAYWLKIISLPYLPWKLIYHLTCRLEKGHVLKVIARKEISA